MPSRTASRSLAAGGDDHVTKPFSIEEVVLRLRALLRRAGITVDDADSQIVVGDLVLDEDSLRGKPRRRDDPVDATEFELPDFMHNLRRVLSKAQILDRVWDYDWWALSNIVELYISYLCKKIDSGRRADDPTRCAAPAMSSNWPADAMVSAPQSSPRRDGAGPRALVVARGCSSDRRVLSPWCAWRSAVTEFALRNYLIGQVDEELREPLDDDDGQPTTAHPPGLGPGHQRRWTRQQEGPGPGIPRLPGQPAGLLAVVRRAGGAVSAGALGSGTAAAVRCRPPTSRSCWRSGLDGHRSRRRSTATDIARSRRSPHGDTVVTALPTGRRRRQPCGRFWRS